jgi:hypothetical protein
MKQWVIALVCASTFLSAHNTFAAIKFKRLGHCGEGLVTLDCECHTGNSSIWHFCRTGHYCHKADGSCRKRSGAIILVDACQGITFMRTAAAVTPRMRIMSKIAKGGRAQPYRRSRIRLGPLSRWRICKTEFASQIQTLVG